jgi:predicted enzyme related to lactoylglutathione lyase
MTLPRQFLKSFVLILAWFCVASGQPAAPKAGEPMKRVTGIGGIFFKAEHADSLRAWYRRHLGIDLEPWGGHAFRWRSEDNPTGSGTTVWSIFRADSKYFEPGHSRFMINYRVENLDELLKVLRSEGCNVDSTTERSEFGAFGWVMDPEGNRIELWQPPHGQ